MLPAMLNKTHLLELADIYLAATGIKEQTLSGRIFNDQKTLAKLRGEGDLSTARFNWALTWYSTNWPEGAVWPEHIERPPVPAEVG